MEAALTSSTFGRTPLTASTLKMGRAGDNQLVLNDPQVSSHHAEIAPVPGGNGYQVTDLNSRNGSFLNEQRLSPSTPRQFNPGDVLRLGATSFTYEGPGSYAATQLASPPSYEPTVMASPPPSSPPGYPNNPPPNYPPVQPAYPQPGAYPQPPAYPQQPGGYPQQPGGYPQQPGGYPQQQPGAYPMHQNVTPQYQPRKGGAGLWVTLVIVLLVVVGGGGGVWYFAIRSTPEKTLQAFCDGWKNKDSKALYNTLSKKGQAETTPDKISQVFGLLAVAGVTLKDCKYSNVQVSGSTATANYVLTATDTKTGKTEDSKPTPLKLVNEDGTWKIDSGGNDISSQSI